MIKKSFCRNAQTVHFVMSCQLKIFFENKIIFENVFKNIFQNYFFRKFFKFCSKSIFSKFCSKIQHWMGSGGAAFCNIKRKIFLSVLDLGFLLAFFWLVSVFGKERWLFRFFFFLEFTSTILTLIISQWKPTVPY